MQSITQGRIVMFKNEEGDIFPAMVCSVNNIVEPPVAGVENLRQELRVCVFDANFGPRMYSTDHYIDTREEGAKWPNGAWTWPPRGEVAAVQIPYQQLKDLVDAAVAEAFDAQEHAENEQSEVEGSRELTGS